MQIFVSEHGSGDRSGRDRNNASAWDNGRGVERAIARAEPDTEIVLLKATYRLSGLSIDWRKSGRYGKPIRLTGEGKAPKGGEHGESVLAVDGTWPTIVGDRPGNARPGDSGQGNDFLRFQDGVENAVIEQLNLNNFARCFAATGGHNEGIAVSAIHADNVRQFADIKGKSGHNQSNDWRVSRCYLTGVAKRAIHAEGLEESSFIDIYADCRDRSGQLKTGDWPLLFHCEADARDLRFERCCGANPSQPGDSYDNGDSFTTEEGTRRIRFLDCIAYQPSDAGFDLKGDRHYLRRCYVENVGNRAYRLWGQDIELEGCMAEGQTDAKGDNAAIWLSDGNATAKEFVGRDLQRPIAIDGSGTLRISNSHFKLSKALDSQGYSLQNSIKQNGRIVEDKVQYQLV